MPDYDPSAQGARCDLCPLRFRPVPPSTPTRSRAPRYIIVGEGPGRLEQLRLEPFVGPSGKLLDRTLREAGLRRYEAHITNAMLCRPDDDRPDIKLAAVSACAPRLAKELSAPRLRGLPLFTLGAHAARATVGATGIFKSRGFVWTAPTIEPEKLRAGGRQEEKMRAAIAAEGETAKRKSNLAKKVRANLLLAARATYAGRRVIPSVHPAFILRGADGWLPVLSKDAERFARMLAGTMRLESDVSYKVASTPAQIARLVGRLKGIAGVPGSALSLDIETPGEDMWNDRIICIGLSNGIDTVVVWPWDKKLAPAFRKALAGRTIVTHYGPQFDHLVLQRDKAWKP